MSLYQRDVRASLERIRCIDEADGQGKAEPYLWTIYIKIGGDEIRKRADDPLRLEGTLHYQFGQGSHGNLGRDSFDAGDEHDIPANVGLFGSRIRPIDLDIFGQNFQVPGVVGIIAILMEEDNVSDDGAEAGHQAMNNLVELITNSVIFFLRMWNQTNSWNQCSIVF